MKKRLLALLLAALMVVGLLPMTVFATGISYAIANGTAQDAKGSITVASSAVKDDTVTVTVAADEGYQLKSLTVAPTGFVDLGIKDAEGKPLYWKSQPRCKQSAGSRRLLYVGRNCIDVFRCGSLQNGRCFHHCD